VPIADTLGALDELVRAGKVREIGCSNFFVDELRGRHGCRRRGALREPAERVQPAAPRTRGRRARRVRRLGLAFLPYFPLASGLLTGKYRRGQPVPAGTRLARLDALTDETLATVEALIAFAESRGRTILELAFAWLLARPVVASVIAGATRPRAGAHQRGRRHGLAPHEAECAEVDAIAAQPA
jgi:aryl-alcohol dehydrogenase-like predicted oxidoreductase